MTTDLTQYVESCTISFGKATRSFKVLSMVLKNIEDPHRHERCSAETNEAFVKRVLQSVTPTC